MKSAVVVTLAALAGVVVLASACDDRGPRPRHHRPPATSACALQTSCGACTPVLGCGFCFVPGSDAGVGGGVCVSDPADCPRQSIGFAWEPSFCSALDAGAGRVTADASLVVADAGDALAPLEDAAPPSSDDASVDAAADGPDGD